jgi:hypothetical protein
VLEQINEVQKLQFELMKRASFNEFDGARVVADLIAHRDLWEGVVMTRIRHHDLICLRDISENVWHVDTVFILAKEGKARELERLAKTWEADEVSWLSEKEASDLLGMYPCIGGVLRIWWVF